MPVSEEFVRHKPLACPQGPAWVSVLSVSVWRCVEAVEDGSLPVSPATRGRGGNRGATIGGRIDIRAFRCQYVGVPCRIHLKHSLSERLDVGAEVPEALA